MVSVQVLYRNTYETNTFTDITSNVTGCRNITTEGLGCPFKSFYEEAQKWVFDPQNTGVRWTEQCQLESTTIATTATSNPTSSAKDSTHTGATSPATSKTAAVTGNCGTLIINGHWSPHLFAVGAYVHRFASFRYISDVGVMFCDVAAQLHLLDSIDVKLY